MIIPSKDLLEIDGNGGKQEYHDILPVMSQKSVKSCGEKNVQWIRFLLLSVGDTLEMYLKCLSSLLIYKLFYEMTKIICNFANN